MSSDQPEEQKHLNGETKRRSVVKALTWRVLASLDTVIIAYFVTGGQWDQALAIGGFEVITKMIIYFFHERAWNRTKWGKKVGDVPNAKTADRKRRSVVKATTWSILGSLDTFILAQLFTKSIKHASSIAIIELFTKPVLYFIHERFWNQLMWGKREFEQAKHEKEH